MCGDSVGEVKCMNHFRGAKAQHQNSSSLPYYQEDALSPLMEELVSERGRGGVMRVNLVKLRETGVLALLFYWCNVSTLIRFSELS